MYLDVPSLVTENVTLEEREDSCARSRDIDGKPDRQKEEAEKKNAPHEKKS